jgi:hypothetical protein
MKSAVKIAKDRSEWHLWYAWHPVRVPVDRDPASRRYRTVWLEWLERRDFLHPATLEYCYSCRLPTTHVEPDGTAGCS